MPDPHPRLSVLAFAALLACSACLPAPAPEPAPAPASEKAGSGY